MTADSSFDRRFDRALASLRGLSVGDALGPFAGRTLPRSTAVVVPGITHWVVPQEPCAASVLVSFLARPTAPDTRCVAGVVPKPFTIIP
ncbi:hypothetical protein ACWCQ0_48135 [Streptomyces massasporeus]